MVKHTAIPWKYAEPSLENDTAIVLEEDGSSIAYVLRSGNAQFIVRACNAHDALTESLQQFMAVVAGKEWSNDYGPLIQMGATALALARGEAVRP